MTARLYCAPTRCPGLLGSTLLVGLLTAACAPGFDRREATEPYPESTEILGVEFFPRTHRTFAPGSDNWPMTWAADDVQYTSWGDGGGFGGTNEVGRVSLGVASIVGGSAHFTGQNVFGSPENSASQATFGGKSYGLIAVGDSLYMWVSPGSGATNLRRAELHVSFDGGRSWRETPVAYTAESDGLGYPTFLQAGRDYSAGGHSFVYMYATRVWSTDAFDVQRPGEIVLARVPRARVGDPSGYEYFTGLVGDTTPTWSTGLRDAEPAFADPNGALRTSVIYVPGLDRYFLFSDHTETHAGNLAIFVSPTPWGPWSLVRRWFNWTVASLPATTFFWNIAPKWLSLEGDRFTLVFSGTEGADGWNSVDGRFLLAPDE